MAVRKIIRMGHPTLRHRARELTPEEITSSELRALVDDMVDTLHDYGGIGLAAPQIDESIRLAIIQIAGGPTRYGELDSVPLTVFANPDIEVLDPARSGYWEGCLSVPGLLGYVERPQHIRVTYTDLDGQPQSVEPEGFLATVFQHEFDHLDGHLFIDRMTDPTKLVFEQEFARYHRSTDTMELDD
jgi:peptide deformylase